LRQRLEIARVAGQAVKAQQRRAALTAVIIAIMEREALLTLPLAIGKGRSGHSLSSPSELRPRLRAPTNGQMRAEPQVTPSRADPQILALAEWLADEVEPARFPMHELRFGNRRWDQAVGLAELTGDEW